MDRFGPAARGGIDTLTWLADNRTLAFTWWPTYSKPASGSMRLLDTAAPGTNLLHNRRELALFNPAGGYDYFVISGNGDVLVGTSNEYTNPLGKVQGQRVPLGSVISFTGPSARAAFLFRNTHRPGQALGYCAQPLWISGSGRQVLVPCILSTVPSKRADRNQLVLFHDGRATMLRQLAPLEQTSDELITIGG